MATVDKFPLKTWNFVNFESLLCFLLYQILILEFYEIAPDLQLIFNQNFSRFTINVSSEPSSGEVGDFHYRRLLLTFQPHVLFRFPNTVNSHVICVQGYFHCLHLVSIPKKEIRSAMKRSHYRREPLLLGKLLY